MAVKTKKAGTKNRVWNKDTDGWNVIPSAQQLLKLAILAWERPGLEIEMPRTRTQATEMIKQFSDDGLFSNK